MGKKTKVALTVGAASVAAWAATKVVSKPTPRPTKAALNYDKPIIIADRGGYSDAPEHTMTAFSQAAELGVHGFAVDVRLTKDEEIIVFHDETMDRTTDFSGKVADYTWQELEKVDAGYMYTNPQGEFPYRNKGEKIVRLQDLLEAFPHLLIFINIQDSPDTYEGSLMPSKLWRLIEETDTHHRVAVSSIYDEQTDRFNLYAQNHVAIGAGHDEIKKAYASFTSKFGHLYNPRTDFFRIPEKLGIFPLNTESFIKFLSQLNVSVYYENVTEREVVKKLIQNGASGVITAAPIQAMEVIQDQFGRS